MKEVVIIGSGPAGVSASLYLARSGKASVKIISSGKSAIEKADKIENYFGFAQPISGKELIENGIKGAKRLNVDFIEEEVVDIQLTDDMNYEILTTKGRYKAEAVLIAAGAARKSPKIKGLAEFEGKGVSYCAVCDAFFFRGKDVTIIGNGEYAVHEAQVLKNTSKSVTILTNGLEPTAEIPDGIELIKKPVSEIVGGIKTEYVRFDDDTEIKADGVFVAVGIAGSTELARKMGIETESGKIKVNSSMETNVSGIYAAGDCTGGLLQVSKSVSDGAIAAMSIIKYLKEK